MFDQLPIAATDALSWSWSQFEPYYADLQARSLTAATVGAWLADWTRIDNLVSEMEARLYVATTQNTADAEADRRYKNYLDTIQPPYQEAQQQLKEKLLASGLEPEGFEIPLRQMRADAALFRQENIPLFTQEAKLKLEYNSVIGAQSITWEGEERTLVQARALLRAEDRAVRERAWRLIAARQLQDRERINKLWQQVMALRRQIAANAGYSSYLDFRWQQLGRFDYTPQDCHTFHKAIEEVVVPAATRYSGHTWPSWTPSSIGSTRITSKPAIRPTVTLNGRSCGIASSRR